MEISDTSVRDYLAELRPGVDEINPSLSTNETLGRLGLLTQGRASRAAVLLFSDFPQREMPGAAVKCVQYHGTDKTAQRESENVTGNARDQVGRVLRFLEARMPRRERPGEAGKTEITYSYPTICVREVLVNAIVHRDYADAQRAIHVRLFDDRIEITSPGSWASRRPLVDVPGDVVKVR